ncbi:hypothetical protein QMA61_17690 [Streptomyces coelicoflavus]|uniref:hypothetical protein n=1 Tax=Streptomyces TaxID=1883 RepID=UPI00129191A8|nr:MULTISPECIES: hypothetical protein [Streptomyces]MCX5040240.1 hypothetical protein [Streptomyces coelicoflavus]MDI6518033.1 hypothetical protein [Streptomyces coelicoflavus]QFX80832.1 hypothetical protein GEV49_07870 [Streptomyces sp. SYP-A7193]
MALSPTAAQRRVIAAADPATGRLKGTDAQLAALVKRGLAFRHPRPPHDHFLTPAGHRIREVGGEPDGVAVAPEPPVAPDAGGVFAARVGGEEAAPGDTGPARLREVRGAWQGLLELRRMTHPDGSTDRPCAWERTHLVRAAALALEAAGHRPAGPDGGDGYRVRATPQPEAVAVYEPDGTALRGCAATLERAGWHVGEHTEPRTRARYLLASPRKV